MRLGLNIGLKPRVGGVGKPPMTGLVSWWKLDEASGTRSDSVGSNHLADHGGVGSVAAKVGNGAAFVGSDYLTGNGLSLSAQFTFVGWVNVASGNWVLAQATSTADRVMEFYLDGDGSLKAAAYDETYAEIARAAVAYGGGWAFFAITFDGANLSLSLNGGTPNTVALSASMSTFTPNLQFGFLAGVTGITGYLDEVGYYTRVLSAGEISQIYNGGSGVTV